MRSAFILTLLFFVSSCYTSKTNKDQNINSNSVICYHNGEIAFAGDTSADVVYNKNTKNWDFIYSDGDTMSFNGDCLK